MKEVVNRLVTNVIASVALLLVAVALTTPPVLAEDWTEIELDRPPEESWLDLEVEWGNLTVVADGGRQIRARMTVETQSGVEQPGNTASLEVGRSGDTLQLRAPVQEEANFVATHIELRVPHRIGLRLSVLRGGEIDVRELSGPLEVSHLNGSVRLENLSGSATVDARNGSIDATFAEFDPTHAYSFATLNGSIDLGFPGSLQADVVLRTGTGGLQSDFDFALRRQDQESAAGRDGKVYLSPTMRGVIGGEGGAQLRAQTINGGVVLRRL